jgi:hypothetical protein
MFAGAIPAYLILPYALQKLYGHALPKIVTTDNPTADNSFLLKMFPSLTTTSTLSNESATNVSQDYCVTQLTTEALIPSIRYAHTITDINSSVDAMLSLLQQETHSKIVVALDCEWDIYHNSRGSIVSSGKIATIQIGYKIEEDYGSLVFSVHHLNTLPAWLLSFLENSFVSFVGINVKGDLSKIGHDFSILQLISNIKDQGRCINLGIFAREQDVIMHGSVSLEI